MSPQEPSVGALVEVPPGRGIVRFVGTTSFAPGRWIGIELYEPNGKNDGSVQGVQYFQCKLHYGVFVRTSQVKIINAEPEVVRTPPSVASLKSPQTASRPTFGHQRTPSTGLARTTSVSNRSASPLKPSTSLNALQSGTPRSRLAAPPASPVKRPSLAFQPRKSAQQVPTIDASPPIQESILNETLPATRQIYAKPSFVSSPPPEDETDLPEASTQLSPAPLSPSPQSPSPSIRERDELRAQAEQDMQELRAKVRVLEARRADDARNLEKLEIQLAEANSFVALRPKLQAKLNSLQQELVSTKRALSDAEQLSSLSENRLLDAQEQLEMAMLDKEVAEERAEALQSEIESLQERLASSEVELSTMRDGSTFDPNDSPEKLSLAYAQLERHNERLKEALIKLRDVSHEAETEYRHRLSEVERELTGVEELHSQYEATLIKLSNAEAQIDDLKMQLDDALGAEEMLVQLTERNLQLGEKIEEMRITIEDLEALKELNDELEENHVETEKMLQEEVDQRQTEMRDLAQKIEDLQYACQDNENTIGQFREMVAGLHMELENQRAENQAVQSENATVASQTAAMMSMNLRLQSSVSKNQARNIDFELSKLEAKESRELVDILQPYVPQIYVDSDSAAVNCYQFFQRIARKFEIINQAVGQIHRLPDSLNGPVTDQFIIICEMRASLSILCILCRRFATVLKCCDPEVFLTLGRLLFDVQAWEKRVDMHVDLLRREEFRESECAVDIDKMTSQFNDISGHFSGYDYDVGERQLGYPISTEYDLDTICAALALAKTTVESIMNEDEIVVELGDLDMNESFFNPLQRLFDQCKAAKMIPRKLAKRMEDLIADSCAIKPELIAQFQAINRTIPALVDFVLRLAQRIVKFVGELRSTKPVFVLQELLSIIEEMGKSTIQDENPWTVAGELVQNIAQAAGALYPLTTETENIIRFNRIPPWIVRIEEVKSFLAINAESENKIAQLTEEIQGLVRNIKARDKNLQEADVKIEMMTRRMEAVKRQADTITDLESELLKARQQEREYEEAIEHFQTEVYTLEQDNTRLKGLISTQEKPVAGPQQPEPESTVVENNYETSYLLEQIEALRGTVRFLRMENSYLKGQDLLREIQALPPLMQSKKLPPTPPLDPSQESSESDSDDSFEMRRPPTFQTLSTESKLLYRDVIQFSSSPRVVDLSVLEKSKDVIGTKRNKAWLPRKQTPGYQLLERQREAERLNRRVKHLLEKTNNLYGQL